MTTHKPKRKRTVRERVKELATRVWWLLFPGLRVERTKSGLPIHVSRNGTTAVNWPIETVTDLAQEQAP